MPFAAAAGLAGLAGVPGWRPPSNAERARARVCVCVLQVFKFSENIRADRDIHILLKEMYIKLGFQEKHTYC